MPILEIKRIAAGAAWGVDGPVLPGQVLNGRISGKLASVAVHDYDEATLEGVLYSSGPIVLFDPEGMVIKVNRLVMGLPEEFVRDVQYLQMAAREPFFGGRSGTQLAEVLGRQFKEGLREMGRNIKLESFVSAVGQWAIAAAIGP